jgi:TIR domain
VLSPSERTKLITEIATRLSRYDWSLIDLTLHQFSLPSEDTWYGTPFAYVIAMVQRATDKALIDLAEHLGFLMGARADSIEPSFWKPGTFRLFITHLADHADVAANLQYFLSKYHISAFVAHKDIAPTREWMDEIELALGTADGLVALLHPGFKESNWTDQETGFALGRGLLVITVRFGQDPYGFLGKAQAIQGEGKQQLVLAEEIFRLLARHKQTQKALAYALLRGFEESATFADAKYNMNLLELNDYWEASFSDRLRKARDENDQVTNAYGIPERIDTLILKHTQREEP